MAPGRRQKLLVQLLNRQLKIQSHFGPNLELSPAQTQGPKAGILVLLVSPAGQPEVARTFWNTVTMCESKEPSRIKTV
jgi:hypothetical protein